MGGCGCVSGPEAPAPDVRRMTSRGPRATFRRVCGFFTGPWTVTRFVPSRGASGRCVPPAHPHDDSAGHGPTATQPTGLPGKRGRQSCTRQDREGPGAP